MPYLVAFLGNPGRQYAQTRHNLGWQLSDALPDFVHASWQSKFHGRFSKVRFGQTVVIGLKPETFMNRSGRAVQAAMHFFKATPLDVVVVHDDLELKFGEVAFKKGGGLGGHNGLRSVAELLGTRDFYRFRLGIGRPVHGSAADFVLGKFTADESIVLERYLQKAADYFTVQIQSASFSLNKAACL